LLTPAMTPKLVQQAQLVQAANRQSLLRREQEAKLLAKAGK